MTRRRSDRIHLQIPISVSGCDTFGRTFEQETVTVNVNRHGACISLDHVLQPDQTIRIRNLRGMQEADFHVVGLVRQVFGSRGEWGVELIDSAMDFWGVEFTPPPESVQPKVLIECENCSKAALVPVSRMEYGMLLHTGLVSRHCEQCDETTRWRPSDKPPVAWEQAQMTVQDERRKTRRMKLSMRLRVRKSGGQTENVQTMDVSKGGLCFFSKQEYSISEVIFLVLPSPHEKESTETEGRIVWAREASGGTLYGVTYLAAAASQTHTLGQTAQVA